MSDNTNFNQSIKYAFPLIRNAGFKKSLYFLVSRLTNNKSIRENHYSKPEAPLYKFFTIFRDVSTCKKNYSKSTKNGKDFHLYNLNKTAQIPLYRDYFTNSGRAVRYYNGISFRFNNKESCYNFLKILKIRPEHVCFAAYIEKLKQYEVVLRFSEGITPKQKDNIISITNEIFNRSELAYKDSTISSDCYIPSTIYDRWFDPFKKRVLWKIDDIRKTFANQVSFCNVVKELLIYRNKLRRNWDSGCRINYFISNIDKLSREKLRENLYIVNHYINKSNPYVRKDARKDWKFAAEQYLNEVIGKIKYHINMYRDKIDNARDYVIEHPSADMNIYMKNIDECKRRIEIAKSKSNNELSIKWDLENIEIYKNAYDKHLNEAIESRKNLIKSEANKYLSVFYSKKETIKFVEKLNIKTKVSAIKLRKIVLSELCKLGIIEIENEYRSKVFCRSYKVLKDSFTKFYSFIYNKIKLFYFIYFNKYNYMLQNCMKTSGNKLIDLMAISKIMGDISDPPG